MWAANSSIRGGIWRNATAAVVVVLAYLPLAAETWAEGWTGSLYKFVPVVFLCAGVLMMRAWHQPSLARPNASSRHAVFLGMALAILLVAILAWSPALGAVSALCWRSPSCSEAEGGRSCFVMSQRLHFCAWRRPFHKVRHRD